MGGRPSEFDVSSYLYTRVGKDLLQSRTCFQCTFNVTKYMCLLFRKNLPPDHEYIKIYDTPSGRVLRELDIGEHPFQFRFARHMNSCFDLPRVHQRLHSHIGAEGLSL